MNKIDRLTVEQEALIPIYRKKWQNIAFSTKAIDRDKVSAAIKQVYSLMDKPDPIIAFCSYSNSEKEILLSYGLNSYGLILNSYFAEVITRDISQQINNKLIQELVFSIRYQLEVNNFWNLHGFSHK